MFDLKGKTALITGAAKRIGRSLTIELAKQGANVVIHYNTSEEKAHALREEVIDHGIKAFLIRADLADPTAAVTLIDNVLTQASSLDILINNASTFPTKNIQDVDITNLNNTMAINAWTPLTLCRRFAQKIGYGKIINFLDRRIVGYDYDRFPYYLSKSMLETLTRALALKYAPKITVNAVAPGLILPPECKSLRYLERLKKTVPLKRYGSVSDIIDTVFFLLRSDFVTGQIIYVDGGKHLIQTLEGI